MKDETVTKPFDLSDQYWGGLSAEHQALYLLVRPQPKATYAMDNGLPRVENFINEQTDAMREMGGVFELEPDFQRGHVWSDDQRKGYVEALLRATAPINILFNCPGWSRSDGGEGDIPRYTLQCIDGLQRLTAVRKFIAGELTVFNGLKAADLKGSPFDIRKYYLKFSVYEFNSKAQLLQFYLDLNGGGTIHPQSELDRVRRLLDQAQTMSALAVVQSPVGDHPAPR